jgi:hypothetical protein
LVVQKSGECVEPLLPELAVAGEPFRRILHGAGGQSAVDHPAFLFLFDQSGFLEDAQVLHESWQRHRERARELGDRAAAACERVDHLPARRVGEGGEYRVERFLQILNHKV